MQPTRSGYFNAVQVYPFTSGALYQVYTAPGQVTDVALQEGEQLVGSGPVAAGDTVRWIIGDTESGTGPTRRIHILVKPTRPDLVTNLVINTDRRTYLLELPGADPEEQRRAQEIEAVRLSRLFAATNVREQTNPIASQVATEPGLRRQRRSRRTTMPSRRTARTANSLSSMRPSIVAPPVPIDWLRLPRLMSCRRARSFPRRW